MNWIKHIGLILMVVSLGCQPTAKESTRKQTKYLMEAEDLLKIIDNDNVKVVDLRRPTEYETGHIPGAINIWRDDLQEHSLPYGGVIAPKQQLEKLLGELGIESRDFLVLYDHKAACEAARFWWILDHYGYENVTILNGGLNAWQQIGNLSDESPSNAKATFEFPETTSSNRIIKLAELTNLSPHSEVILLDARTAGEYSGVYMKKGAFDSGRIPGSINLDWMHAMNEVDHTFKSVEELKTLYASLGVNDESNVVTYCHSGVRSAHTLFVLTQLLGYENVRNYDGSWVEWSYHQLPVERDSLLLN